MVENGDIQGQKKETLETEPEKPIFRRNKFFLTTDFSGFGLIQESNSLTESILWYVLIAAFVAITVRNVCALTQEFVDQETVTKVTITKLTKPYVFRQLHLRISVTLPELNPEYRELDPTRANKLYPGARHSNLPLDKELDQALEQWNPKQNQSWPYVLYPLIMRHAAVAVVYEFWTTDVTAWEKFEPQINKILAHCQKFGVDERQLVQLFGPRMLELLNFEGNFDLQPNNTHLLRIVRTYGHNWELTYEINKLNPVTTGVRGSFALDADFKPVMIETVDREKIENQENATVKQKAVEFNNAMQSAAKWCKDMGVFLQLDLGGVSYLAANFHHFTFFKISVVSIFHTIQNCDKNTYTDLSEQCQHDCVARELPDVCSCNSVLSLHNRSKLGLPVCTVPIYKVCGEALGTLVKKCTYSCYNPCHLAVYQSIPHRDRRALFGSIKIIAQLNNATFTNFTERWSQSFMGYVAELGGALDLFIGASLIAITHMIIYFIKQIFYWCKRDSEKGQRLRKRTILRHKTENVVDTMKQMSGQERQETNLDENKVSSTEMEDMIERIVEQKIRQMIK